MFFVFKVNDNVIAGENDLIWSSRCILIEKSITNNSNLFIYNKIIVRKIGIDAVNAKIKIEWNSNL